MNQEVVKLKRALAVMEKKYSEIVSIVNKSESDFQELEEVGQAIEATREVISYFEARNV